MNVKVSVIVAVYNTSAYLRQCLDSIEAQSFRELECVIIDDGSTDGSGAICDEYAERNPIFKVLHKPNGGLASARQAGLDMARGEYVIVCDGDDWVEPEMYGTLYEKVANSGADIAICGYWREYRNGACEKVIFGSGGKPRRDCHGFLNEYLSGSWNKLVRRSLLVDNGLSYERGIDMGEDLLMNYKIAKTDPLWINVPVALYHYRIRIGETSYTNYIKPDYINQRFRVHNWMRENYREKEYSRHVLRDAIGTVCLSALSVSPDKEFISGFESGYIRWKSLFNHASDRRILRFMVIKLFATTHKIALIRAYSCYETEKVFLRYRIMEFLSSIRRKKAEKKMKYGGKTDDKAYKGAFSKEDSGYFNDHDKRIVGMGTRKVASLLAWTYNFFKYELGGG